MAHERLQFLYFRAERLPGVWCLRCTKVCDEICVQFVGLIAQQFTPGIIPNASWIDHTDHMPLSIQILGQLFPIPIGRFHASMTTFNMVALQPSTQFPKVRWLVDKLMTFNLLSYSQRHLITLLGNIDAQHCKLHLDLRFRSCFTSPCLSDRPCECELSISALLIPSDLCKPFPGEGHDLRFRVFIPWSPR